MGTGPLGVILQGPVGHIGIEKVQKLLQVPHPALEQFDGRFDPLLSLRALQTVAATDLFGQVLDGLDPKDLRGLLDQAKQRLGSGVAAIVAVNDGRASIAAAVTDDLTGRFSAVDLVRAGVAALGGKGGGGRPDMAQGGGPDGDKAPEAIAAIRTVLAG